MNNTNSGVGVQIDQEPQTFPSPLKPVVELNQNLSHSPSIEQIVAEAHGHKASDIHIRVGQV
ncbi:MAG: type IV pili twitching motility protein PilT, partial [Moorea sp. SIO4A3]|nr:type IV pili twitching motility protein PilT [Moorena sp. SIO4A3]